MSTTVSTRHVYQSATDLREVADLLDHLNSLDVDMWFDVTVSVGEDGDLELGHIAFDGEGYSFFPGAFWHGSGLSE